MSWLTSWRLALRIARRDASRHCGRGVLVAVLVALPVAGLIAASVLARGVLDPAQPEWTVGAADMAISIETPGALDATRQTIEDTAPGARTLQVATGSTSLVAGGERLGLQLRAGDLGDGLGEGLVVVREGRLPDSSGEIAVSAVVLDVLEVELGDVVELPVLGSGEVVGEVALPAQLSAPLAVAGGAPPAPGAEWTATVLVEIERPEQLGDALTEAESAVVSWFMPQMQPAPDDQGFPAVTLFAALAAFEVSLVAGAAFAVGARRALRSLGLVAATGATPAETRRIVLAGGVVLGGIGVVAGVVIGVVSAYAVNPVLPVLLDRVVPAVSLPPGRIALAAALGFAAALGAAAVPAYTAARVPVLEALRGGRPPERRMRWATLVGLAVVIAGAALTLRGALGIVSTPMVIAGCVAVVAGVALCARAAIGVLAWPATRVSAAGRIALRDLLRQRARNGPAVAAVMGALALPIALGTFALATDARDAEQYRPLLGDDQLVVTLAGEEGVGGAMDEPARAPGAPDPSEATRAEFLELDEAVRLAEGAGMEVRASAELVIAGINPADDPPGTERAEEGDEPVAVGVEGPARADVVGHPSSAQMAIGSSELLAALGVPDAAGALEAGEIIGIGPDAFDDRDDTAVIDPRGRAITVTGVTVDGPHRLQLPRYVVSPDRAAELGLVPIPVTRGLLASGAPVESDAVDLFRDQLPSESFVLVEDPLPNVFGTLRWLATVAAAAVALGVVAIAAALAATEARRDRALLHAVGADPQLRRRIAATQTGAMALLAGVLAVPAGLIPAAAILVARGGYPFVVPISALVTALVVVPVLATLGAAVVARAQRTPALPRAT